MRSPSHFACALLLALAAGCATQSVPLPSTSAQHSQVGETKASAIEVCRPAGQRAYLDRLQCADGSALSYRRIGSFGERTKIPDDFTDEEQAALFESVINGTQLRPGEPDYHVIDGYVVNCGTTERVIYMDMYHCSTPATVDVPAGFTRRSTTH
jgi:hypothetical protein